MNTQNQISPPKANIETFQFRVKPLECLSPSPRYIFSEAPFLNERSPGMTFYLLDLNNVLVAYWHIFIQGNSCSDHYRLPFGQIVFNPNVEEGVVRFFTLNTMNELKAMGIRQISSFLPPICYDENVLIKVSHIFDPLAKKKHVDVNQHLPITADSFFENLSNSFKSRINKMNKLHWKFQLETPDRLKDVYAQIVKSMGRKQFPVTMSLDQIQSAFHNFPESYFLFTVTEQEVLIAAAVSVRVNENILYNIFHSDSDSHRQFSPTIFLIAGIYEFAKKSKFQILDLGTSSVEGIINEGLFNFKKKLGAITTEKTKYLVDLSNV